MKKAIYYLWGGILYITFSGPLQAQQGDTTLQKLQTSAAGIDTKTLSKLNGDYGSIEQHMNTASTAAIRQFQQKEARLKKKMMAIDSTKAKKLFNNSEQFYNDLQHKLNNTQSKVNKITHYMPGLDSMQAVSKLFSQVKGSFAELAPDKLFQMNQLNGSVNGVQGSIESATDISQSLNQRQQQLESSLQPFGLNKDLFSNS